MFTPGEKRLLQFLVAFVLIGFLVQQGRQYLRQPTTAEQAERSEALELFRSGSQAYLERGDSADLAAWATMIDRPIDVNRAGSEQLQQLHGIGPVLAKKIIDYRMKNGYFQTVQDISKVPGIGPKLLMRWKGLLTAQPDTTVKKGTSID